jgi:predicted RNA-binding protein YlxR (DUF448 family)
MSKTAERAAAQPPVRQKRVPIRTCVVCRQQAGKRDLMRVVRVMDADGSSGVFIDPSGKRAGRGAYLCDQTACWQKAAEGEVLAKALRTTLTPEDRERIRQFRTASE